MLKKSLLILILIQINLFAYNLKFIKKINTKIIIGDIYAVNNQIILCDKINDKLKFYTPTLKYQKEIAFIYYGDKQLTLKTNNLDISDFNEAVFMDNNRNIVIFNTIPMILNFIKTKIDITPLKLYFLSNGNIIANFNNKLSNISIINNAASIIDIFRLSPTQKIIGKENNYIFINDLKNKELIVITDYGKIINKIPNPIADNIKKILIYNTDIMLIPKNENYIIIKTQASHQKIKCTNIKLPIQDAAILNNNIYFLDQNGKIYKYKIITNNTNNK